MSRSLFSPTPKTEGLDGCERWVDSLHSPQRLNDILEGTKLGSFLGECGTAVVFTFVQEQQWERERENRFDLKRERKVDDMNESSHENKQEQ